MAESGLEPNLIRFVEEHIPTVEHLEVLLLVSSAPKDCWTVAAVNEQIRSTEASIALRLQELAGHGLLEKAPAEESYRAKGEPELQQLLARLRAAYKDWRVRLIEAIYAPKSDAVREFARAFDIRNRKR